jgi:predicted short-subunit dehydrogenase-like oxidoreductase (DUF2520 family)
MEKSVAIIGLGAVGRSLAMALNKTGQFRLTLVGLGKPSEKKFAKSLHATYLENIRQLADNQYIILTVDDVSLPKVTRDLAKLPSNWPKTTVLHTSGPQGIKVLQPLAKRGAGVAAWHPYQTFPRLSKRPLDLQGVTFGITANPRGGSVARNLTRIVGGIPLTIKEENRLLYHASAVFACGLVAENLLIAEKILRELGIENKKALAAILKIAESTIANARDLGIRNALTGPAARGDKKLVRAHIQALKKIHPEIAQAYWDLSTYLLKQKENHS